MIRADSASGRLGDVARAVQVELVQGGGIADLRKTLEAPTTSSPNSPRCHRAVAAADGSHALPQRAAGAVDSASIDSTVKNLKATSANMAEMTKSLEHATTRLDAILAKVDTGSGTTGKLVNDPTLYNDLHAVLTRLDSLTTDLQHNPKRYINVHVF